MVHFDKIYWFIGVCKCKIWLLCHPGLWGKGLCLSGIPRIDGISGLKLGRNVAMNDGVYIQCVVWGGVQLGDCVTLSHGCVILTSGLDTNHYPERCMVRDRKHVNKPVVISDGVWLGACSMVMPGVSIAKNIIVAAGAVVTKDLEKEGWLYGGIPAKPIKRL